MKILISLAASITLATAAEKPNVIVIMTDDQGSKDVNCYGAKDLVTPNMDKLAANGVKFEHFYSAAPVCCPSRAGFITGQHPWKVGVKSNIGINAEGMPSMYKTMGEYFKEAGYATAHIGKWHLGHHKGSVPNAQGFDFSFGHLVGCIDNYSHYFYWSGPNKHDLWENGKEVLHPGKFFPDLMRDKALDFTKKTDEPFFMYYAMNLPHYPYQAPTKWIEYYKDLKMPRKLYAAALSAVDENLGQLLDGLKAQGKLENTIVVFMSDHGHSTEVRAFGGGGWAGEFRGAKFSLFEGGIRVPAMISFPKLIPKGAVRQQMCSSLDWAPTLLDLCQIKYDAAKFDGKSIKPVLLENAATPHEHLVWLDGKQSAVRMDKWKLVKNGQDSSGQGTPKDKGICLYDLSKDPGEKNDLSMKHPDIVLKMRDLLPK